MATFTKDDVIYRVCKTVVQLIKNHVEEERGGIHSRLFSYVLHPEQDFVCIGKTEAVINGEAVHPEHLVPCTILIQEVRRLLSEKTLEDVEIAKLLQKHWKIALISKEQARYIDYDLGYKSTMPAGWNFESGDTLARLHAAKITLIALDTPLLAA